MKFIEIFCFISLIGVDCIMIKKECHQDEVHKACSFFEEYTCWVKDNRLDRVKAAPLKLSHCKSGCFCQKGFVREFPKGPCIIASGCRDHKLKILLENLPKKLPNFALA